jgi:hypothetical protein
LGLYQDFRNTRNINELEEKLAYLESQAAPIIQDLHDACDRGTLTLERESLELLQKFLFIMHCRNKSRYSLALEADRPEIAKAHHRTEHGIKGVQSDADSWRRILRYYLDLSHSDLMRDAAKVVEKCGEEGFQEMHVPSVTYRTYVDDYFLSIWEAAPEEEFIITPNAFGLSEGSAGSRLPLHRIFVLSPHVAVVLCNERLRPETKRYTRPGSLKSFLLNVNPAPPTPMYAVREDATHPRTQPRSLRKREIDSFEFEIKKLTRSQTVELNSVALFSLEETGSLTFESGTKMLRTAQAFRSNFPSSHLVITFIARLTASLKTEAWTLCSPVQSPAAASDEDFDPLSLGDSVLYVLLMQICSGRRQFPSAYDRAHLILKIMAKAKPTSFSREISRKVHRTLKACWGDVEDGMSFAEDVNSAPLLSSIPSKLSSQLFQLMIPYMTKRGAAMSADEGTLEVLQRDVAVLSFLQRASRSFGVWHALSHSSPEAPKILSRLFKKGTPADEFIGKTSPSGFASGFNRAYALRKIYGVAGPTTSPISQRYYELMAFLTRFFDDPTKLKFPREPYSAKPHMRRKAQLIHIMPKAHSDLLMKEMKMLLQAELSKSESGKNTLDKTTKEWVDEMAIVGCLTWLGKHRRHVVDFIQDAFPSSMNLKLFEGEVTRST